MASLDDVSRCTGIHTLCIENTPIFFVCTRCEGSNLSYRTPVPKLCKACAGITKCPQCARELCLDWEDEFNEPSPK